MNTVDTLSNIAWFPTIKLALARGFSSGLVLAVVMSWQSPSFDAVFIPFYWAIFSLLLFGTVHLLSKVIPFLWMASFLLSLMIIVGDPIVYVFNRIFPKILDLADFKILNFHPLIIVYHPE